MGGLEHYRRMASMKIPELQRTVQAGQYALTKKDQQIQDLQRLVRIYESQMSDSSAIQSAQLTLGRSSVLQRRPRTQSVEKDSRQRSNSGPATVVPGVDLAPIVEAQKRRIQALKQELAQTREHNHQQQERYQSAVAYKGKVREEFRQLHGELHGQQQALVKARREVRRLVGKRSEERMQYEKLLAEHQEIQKKLNLPLSKCMVPAPPKPQQVSPKKHGKSKRNRK